MTTFLVLIVALIAACSFLGFGVSTLGRADRRAAGWAGLAAAAACALYAWGALHVAGAVMDAEDGGTGSAPLRPCRSGPQVADPGYLGYHVDFVPLRFVCETKGGGEYVADTVPPYVNPALLGLAAVTVCLGAGATVAYERGERRRAAARGGA
ncbi:hypothetical protein [Streptomyces sp. cg35]|uniref:hypothetical protein n=1 Tax=Streptomyces sp. cg35 TaxID=3421650 RepID=UPI003D17DF2D